MVDFIITDFSNVRGGGNIVDTVPSPEDFIVDNCTISSIVSGEFVLTPGASLVGSVSLTVSSASVTVGGSVTLTATVLDDEDAPLTDKQVVFKMGNSIVGTGITNSSGVATYTRTMDSTGHFACSGSCQGVTSSAVMVTVSKITSTISLSAVSSTISVGDSPQLTGTLSVGSGESVKIYLGDVLVDTVTTGTNGAFSFTGSATSTSGSLTFKAVYDGDSTHSSVTSSNVVITVSGSTPVMDSISLTEASSKTILSAYDSDTASLTATVLDTDSSGMSGVTVTFKKNGTSIGTATTNSNGVATKSYSAAGSGDISFTAECSDGSSTFVSETYAIEDCYAYVTSFSNWSSVTNKGTAYKFSPFVLPTNHRIEFKLKSGTAIRLACGDATHTNNSGYLEWIYAWYTDKLYYRNSSNSELNVNTGLSSANTSTVYALEYNGTTITLYSGSTVLKTQTGYDPLTLTRYLRYHDSYLGSVDYFKIKAL